jgi:hypothetical protein
VLKRLTLAVLAFLTGCTLVPRLPTDVSRAVNRDDMRVLRSANIDLYYPAAYEPQARALAERAEGCLHELRARTTANTGISQRRVEPIFPNLPFNNAFVHPPLNGDFFSVVPTYWSLDIITETGIVPDPGYIAQRPRSASCPASSCVRSSSSCSRARRRAARVRTATTARSRWAAHSACVCSGLGPSWFATSSRSGSPTTSDCSI